MRPNILLLWDSQMYRGTNYVEWPLLMAATTIVVIPTIIAFYFTQNTIVESVTLTGLKGLDKCHIAHTQYPGFLIFMFLSPLSHARGGDLPYLRALNF